MSVINRFFRSFTNMFFLRRNAFVSGLLLPTGIAFHPLAYAVDAPGDVFVAQASNSSLKVTWTDNSCDETGFRVQIRSSTDGGQTWGSWSTEGIHD